MTIELWERENDTRRRFCAASQMTVSRVFEKNGYLGMTAAAPEAAGVQKRTTTTSPAQ